LTTFVVVVEKFLLNGDYRWMIFLPALSVFVTTKEDNEEVQSKSLRTKVFHVLFTPQRLGNHPGSISLINRDVTLTAVY